jgi:hypothetical protein
MYVITPYTYRQAKKLGVKVRPSKYKLKKLDVYTPGGKYITSVGQKGYNDYGTYIIQSGKAYADTRRRLYKLRHSKDRTVKNSPGYYAYKLLW